MVGGVLRVTDVKLNPLSNIRLFLFALPCGAAQLTPGKLGRQQNNANDVCYTFQSFVKKKEGVIGFALI